MPDIKQKMLEIYDLLCEDEPHILFSNLISTYIEKYCEDKPIIPKAYEIYSNKPLTRDCISEMIVTEDPLSEFVYNLALTLELKQSEEDKRNGRFLTIEESKKRLKQKYPFLDLL